MFNNKILKEAIRTYEEISENPYYGKLRLNEEYQELLKLASKINNYRFKVILLGEFSTGKSTLLNSLMKEELLPVGILPTTKQILKIEHSEREYVITKKNPNKEIELTVDNIKQLVMSLEEEIEIYKRLPEEIKIFTFYDTPGVNDINEMPERLIFELLPSSDIVIFVLDSTKALRKTELEFLSNIVQKKDLEKFFFIINKSDLVGNEIESIRRFVIDNLSNTLNIGKDFFEDRVIPYSAIKSLEIIKNNNTDDLIFTGHKLLIEKIRNFIFTNKAKLIEDRIKEDVLQIIDKSLTKINVTIDKIKGIDKEYLQKIQELNNQIEEFKKQIHAEINEFTITFNQYINDFKAGIEKSFIKIRKKVGDKIDETDFDNLSHQGYIETLIKSLIEKEINDNAERFIKNLSKIVGEFDSKIMKDLNSFYENSDTLEVSQFLKPTSNDKFQTFFKVAGAVSVPFVAVELLPSLLGGSLIGTLVGAAITVGMIFSPETALTVGKAAGTFTIKAGELTAQFMQWISEQLSVTSNEIGKYLKKEEYKKRVFKHLDDIRDEILEKINEVDANEFIDKYIQTKFPQKLEIEKRMELLKLERNENLAKTEEDIKYLEIMKKRLGGVINGI